MVSKKATISYWSKIGLGCSLLIISCSLVMVIVTIISLKNNEEYVETKQLISTPKDFDEFFNIAASYAKDWDTDSMLKIANGGVSCEPGNLYLEDRGTLFFFSAKKFYFGTNRLAMARINIDENNKMSIAAGPSQGFGWPGIDPRQFNIDLYAAIELAQLDKNAAQMIQEPNCKIEFFLSGDTWNLTFFLDPFKEEEVLRFNVNTFTGEVVKETELK